MSDDSFIREVDEELRSARVKEFWEKYGKILIAVAVAIVVGTASYRYYEYHTANKAAEAGDAFMAAITLSGEGKSEEALVALEALEAQDSKAYQVLALMRGAAELAKNGNSQKAIEKFDAIANDSSADENMRAIARIRAAFLLVDSGSVEDVESRVGPLSAPGAPYRGLAREAIGLAHYKVGDLESAFKQFESLATDNETPNALNQRTRIMLDLIASKGGPVREQ